MSISAEGQLRSRATLQGLEAAHKLPLPLHIENAAARSRSVIALEKRALPAHSAPRRGNSSPE